ncbi:cytochrome C [Candidatus Desantisbacteria bacterium]|nr:cytochrome C [Candidatus Desantisbacteria bacterium]
MNKFMAIIIVLIFGAVLLSPFVINAVRGAMGDSMSTLNLVLPEGGSCVKDTAYMRANHMDILKKARVEAVRDGKRTSDYSLKNCQTCHTKRDEFCDRCHHFVGVKPECFECHYYPTSNEGCERVTK